MGRNRKLDVKFMMLPSSPWVYMFVTVVCLSLIYIYLCCREYTLSQGLKILEKQNLELNGEYKAALAKWAELKSPESLYKALAKHQLPMKWPEPDQIIWIKPEDYSGYSSEIITRDVTVATKDNTTGKYLAGLHD